MIYRISLLFVLGLIGFGLVLNAMNYSESPAVSASNELNAPLSGDYYSSSSAPLSAAPLEPLTYDDVLASLHPGQWFTWSDPTNKVYSNLVVLDNQYAKPSQATLDSLLASAESTRTNKATARALHEASKVDLETAIANGTAGLVEIQAYLRYLGDF